MCCLSKLGCSSPTRTGAGQKRELSGVLSHSDVSTSRRRPVGIIFRSSSSVADYILCAEERRYWDVRPTTARLLQLSRLSSRRGLCHLISKITMHIGKEKKPPISILVSAMMMPLSIWTTGVRSAYEGELKSMNSSSGECVLLSMP